VIVRRATPAELDAVGELTVRAYAADGYLTSDDPYVAELRAAQDRSVEAELLVAIAEDGTLLGTVTFTLPGSPWAEISRPGEAEFRMLAVDPQARGRGVGGALAQWCVDRAREQDCAAVALSSLAEMHAAHRIYRRMGFVREPERDWQPAPGVQLVAYVLALT
jgi:ribosomal protein S18 acetylase RimI-like enzyme